MDYSAAVVLYNLHAQVTGQDVIRFLTERNLEQGISWENVIMSKKSSSKSYITENLEEVEEILNSNIVDCNNNEVASLEQEAVLDNNDEQKSQIQVGNISSSTKATATKINPSKTSIDTSTVEEAETLTEQCHEMKFNDDDVGDNRGFIICLDLHVARYLAGVLEGQCLFGKTLNLKIAEPHDIEELIEFRRSQPKIVVTSTYAQADTTIMDDSGLGVSMGNFERSANFDMSNSYNMNNSIPMDNSTSCHTSIHIVPKSATTMLNSVSAHKYLPLRLLLPESFTRIIIGPNKQTVNWIAEASSASVAILEKQFYIIGNSWVDKMVVLYGSEESYKCALELIINLLGQEVNACLQGHRTLQSGSFKVSTNELVGDDGATLYLRMVTFNSITGRLIGKLGRNLKEIMAATNTKITISSTPYTWNEPRTDADRIVHIAGAFDDVLEASFQVSQKLNAAFTSQYHSTGVYPGEIITHPSTIATITVSPLLTNQATQNLCLATQRQLQPPPPPVILPLHVSQALQQHQTQMALRNPAMFGMIGNIPSSPSQMISAPASSIMMNGGLSPSLTGLSRPVSVKRYQQQAVQRFDIRKWCISYVYCPSTAISNVIGNIQNIHELTNVIIEVNNVKKFKSMVPLTGKAKLSEAINNNEHNNSNVGLEEPYEKQLILSGALKDHLKAQCMIFCSVAKQNISDPSDSPADVELTVEFRIPTRYVARIIGKQGVKLQNLQRETSTYILFNTEGFVRGRNSDIADTTSVKVLGTYQGVSDVQSKIFNLLDAFESSEIQNEQAVHFHEDYHQYAQSATSQQHQQPMMMNSLEACGYNQNQTTDYDYNYNQNGNYTYDANNNYVGNYNNVPIYDANTPYFPYQNNQVVELRQQESSIQNYYVPPTMVNAYTQS